MRSVAKGLQLVIFLIATALAPMTRAEQLAGIVIGVTDGDTVTLLDEDHQQHKIRLAGIDAPEKKQPYGQQAKASLSRMAFGHSVTIDWKKRDKYGRIIGKIMLGNQDINLKQVRFGLAWWYRQYANEQSPEDGIAYETAETAAKQEHLGLWRDESPISPSSWRRLKR